MLDKPRNVIISIKPEFALKIMSGEKTIELRRKFPVNGVVGGVALIYASSPLKKIIGYALIEGVKEYHIDTLWKKHKNQVCVSRSFFYSYFEGVERGFALRLEQPVMLDEALDLRRMEDEFYVSAPQSFRYAPDEVMNCVAA